MTSFKVKKESERQIVRRSLICRWWADAFRPGETRKRGRRKGQQINYEINDVIAFIFFFSTLFWILFSFSFISGLRDGSIAIWNPLETDETKQKRFLPQKHSVVVISLSCSPDGRFLASADRNGEIIIWSTEVRNGRGKMCNWACAVCYCQFTSCNGLSNRRAPVSSFTKLFFLFPSIFRLGRFFSPVQVFDCTRVSLGCNSTPWVMAPSLIS